MSKTTRNKREPSPRVSDLVRDTNPLPVWVRAPKRGPEHFSGFSRAKLYLLDQQKRIRSVSIREPGQVKGTRLFHLQSILDFIERCEMGAS